MKSLPSPPVCASIHVRQSVRPSARVCVRVRACARVCVCERERGGGRERETRLRARTQKIYDPILCRGKTFLSTPQALLPKYPYWLRGSPRFVFSGLRGLFRLGVKGPRHGSYHSSHVVPRMRMSRVVSQPPYTLVACYNSASLQHHCIVLAVC